MKNRIKYKLIISYTLLVIHYSLFTCYSQDIHFTQFNYSPLTLNPANTGQFYGDDRFSLIDRDQWSSVSSPFQTFSASFDTKLLTRPYQKDMIGIGVVFYRDQAGDADFGTTEASLSLSYTKSIDRLKRHFLTFALQGGMAQRTINYGNLTFDNQFNGNTYDPNMSSYEQFNKNNFFYPDISAGISWAFFINSKTNINSGISLFHINQPNQSVMDNGESKLDSRFSTYINLETYLTDKLCLAPTVFYMLQGTSQEADIGAFLKIVKDKTIINYTSFNIGGFTRAFDAVNVIASMDYKKFTVGLSYDINYSGLDKASNGRGAWELAVIYRIFKSNKPLNQTLPCKIF